MLSDVIDKIRIDVKQDSSKFRLQTPLILAMDKSFNIESPIYMEISPK